MHRLAVLVPLLIALAAPAAAQDPKAPVSKTTPAKAQAMPKRLQSPIPAGPSPEQCRATCAQTYYFCLSGNEPQDCSPQWAQCRVACGDANALPR